MSLSEAAFLKRAADDLSGMADQAPQIADQLRAMAQTLETELRAQGYEEIDVFSRAA